MTAAGVFVVVRDGSYAILPVILAGVLLMVLGLAGSDKDLDRLGGVALKVFGSTGLVVEDTPPTAKPETPEKAEKLVTVSPSSTRSAEELASEVVASDADVQLRALEEAERVCGSFDQPARRELLEAAKAARPRGRTRGDRRARRKRVDALIALLER